MTINSQFHFDNNEEEDEQLIEEEELLGLGLTIQEPEEPRERSPRFKYTLALVDRLLAEAGYEPSDIPKRLRRAALDVARAWKSGLGNNDEDIARATGRTPHDVRKAARALRFAGNPNSNNNSKDR